MARPQMVESLKRAGQHLYDTGGFIRLIFYYSYFVFDSFKLVIFKSIFGSKQFSIQHFLEQHK